VAQVIRFTVEERSARGGRRYFFEDFRCLTVEAPGLEEARQVDPRIFMVRTEEERGPECFFGLP
jgi:hypothetical protein